MKHLVWATLLFAILAHAGTPQVAVRTYRGVWQTGTSYVQGETTFYQGQTYIAVVDNQGVTPGTDETKWTQKGASDVVISPSSAAPGSVPSGMILFIDTGSCPTGWTELAAAGNYLLLTQAANNDAGTTGGSNSYTPTGTIASTFTGSQVTTSATSAGTPAGTVAAPTFTGSQVTSGATSGGTPAGTLSASAQTKFSTSSSGTLANTTATQTFTGSALATHTHTVTATGTNSAPAFTGSALATHTHTETAAGTVASTLTGTPATIQPTYVRLIGCKKQ